MTLTCPRARRYLTRTGIIPSYGGAFLQLTKSQNRPVPGGLVSIPPVCISGQKNLQNNSLRPSETVENDCPLFLDRHAESYPEILSVVPEVLPSDQGLYRRDQTGKVDRIIMTHR